MRPEKGPRRNRREQSPPRRSRRWVAAGAVILLAAAGLIYARMTVQSRPTKPNVVLILIDALRPDRLHCYGYERRTSPNLDALAADGAMFTDAMAQAPETLVSTPSLFTGRYPQEHGMQWMERGPDIFIGPHLGLPSIAELLRGAGYETAAVSGSPIIGPGLGFDRGFDHFDQSRGLISNSQGMNAGDLNVAVSEWLDQRDTRRPFFLYIHYLDPHHAYHPPREFAVFGTGAYTPQDQQLNVKVHQLAGQYKNTGITDAALAGAGLSRADVGRLSDLYDGEVLCVDHYVGELVRRLKDDGLYDHTIIIVTADHGQAFLEHGNLKHGGSLYQVLLRVPLIVRRPASRRGERIGGLVQEVDIAAGALNGNAFRRFRVPETAPGPGPAKQLDYALDVKANSIECLQAHR